MISVVHIHRLTFRPFLRDLTDKAGGASFIPRQGVAGPREERDAQNQKSEVGADSRLATFASSD